jgi:sterol 3beta-glucosyltransferase
MIVKAKVLGEQIRKVCHGLSSLAPTSSANHWGQENGVEAAVQCIYRDLEYATNLIKSKAGKNQTRREAAANATATANNAGATSTDGAGSGAAVLDGHDFMDDDEEESWTFVGGDAETIDDLTAEGIMKRTNVTGVASPGGVSRALGSTVLGGAAGSGSGGTGLGLGVKSAGFV